jgi:hypothetical protein
MKNLKFSLMFALLILLAGNSFGQDFSYSGVLGYAKPQGNAFTDAAGNKLSSFGISYEADVLYYQGLLDGKLGLGLTYVGSVLFGKTGSGTLDIGVYGLSLYGVKGLYRLRDVDNTFSPYGAMGLGVSVFETPEMSSGSTVIIPADRSFSLGIRPELGLEIGGFVISASYFVPMNYDVKSALGSFKGSAGAFTIGLGYRGYLSF